MHDKPGGLCAAWQRKGYTIDAGVHMLGGSGPGHSFYQMWQELGALQGRQIVDHDETVRIEGDNGNVLDFYCDIDKLEQHMKEIAPEDRKIIESFTSAIRRVSRWETYGKAPELTGIMDKLRMIIKIVPLLRYRWMTQSLEDFALRFKNPFLRQVFPYTFDYLGYRDKTAVMGAVMILSLTCYKRGGYPVGGSLEFARGIEKNYLNLGGVVNYKSKVVKILVENDSATGVLLEDGTEHHGDIVISAADSYMTVFNMLEGKYIDKKVRKNFDNAEVNGAYTFTAFGVNRTFDDIPTLALGLSVPLDNPVNMGGVELSRLPLQISNFDPTLAPSGKTLVRCFFISDYEYWRRLYDNPQLYKEEKQRVADTIIAALDKRFPGFASQVEVYDVATPVTFERYTGNRQGSCSGWVTSMNSVMINRKRSLPGLDNFYMAGQWIMRAGGLPTSAESGREAIQIICKNDKKKFVTTTP